MNVQLKFKNKKAIVAIAFLLCLSAAFLNLSLVHATTDSTPTSTSSFNDWNGEVYFCPIIATSSGPLQSVGVELGAVSGNVETALYSTFSGTQISGLIGESSSTVATSGWDDLAIPSDYSIVPGQTYYLSVQVDNVNTVIYETGSVNMYEIYNYAYGSFPTSTPSVTVTSTCLCMRMTYGSTVQATPTPTPYQAPTPTPYGTQPTPYQYPTPTPTTYNYGPTPTPATVYVLGYGFSDTDLLIIVVAIAIICVCGAYVGWSINQGNKHKGRKHH
ncbi:MAG: hypothetical protein ABSC20_08165 [Candidatus Bathyarchaeia archaeon]